MPDKNRERSNAHTVRYSDAEEKELRQKAKAAALSLQDYIRQASLFATVEACSKDALSEAAQSLKEFNVSTRNTNSNINQIAKKMNTYKECFTFEDEYDFMELQNDFKRYRKEALRVCQLLKTLTAKVVEATNQRQHSEGL